MSIKLKQGQFSKATKMHDLAAKAKIQNDCEISKSPRLEGRSPRLDLKTTPRALTPRDNATPRDDRDKDVFQRLQTKSAKPDKDKTDKDLIFSNLNTDRTNKNISYRTPTTDRTDQQRQIQDRLTEQQYASLQTSLLKRTLKEVSDAELPHQLDSIDMQKTMGECMVDLKNKLKKQTQEVSQWRNKFVKVDGELEKSKTDFDSQRARITEETRQILNRLATYNELVDERDLLKRSVEGLNEQLRNKDAKMTTASSNHKQSKNAALQLQSFGKMFVDVLDHFIGRFMSDKQDQKTQLALYDISTMISSRLQNISTAISSLDFKNELQRIKNWTSTTNQNLTLDDFSHWLPANYEDQEEPDISQQNKDLYDLEPLMSASPTTLQQETNQDYNDSALKESKMHTVSLDPKASVNDKNLTNINSNHQIKNRQNDAAVIETAIAVHDYEKQEDGDLDFKENDTIQIIKKWPSGWAIGKNSQGRIGTIPLNHIKTLQ